MNFTKATLDLAIANDDKETIFLFLDPITAKLASMIKAGVLIENVKRHLTNNGITGKANDMIIELTLLKGAK